MGSVLGPLISISGLSYVGWLVRVAFQAAIGAVPADLRMPTCSENQSQHLTAEQHSHPGGDAPQTKCSSFATGCVIV